MITLIPAAKRAAFFVLAAALAAVSFWGPATAGEEATTHRAGDLVTYSGACHDAESMIAVAERGGLPELWAVMMEQGRCFRAPRPIAAVLEEWLAGPYRPASRPAMSGSVWRVLDQLGDTEFVWLNDTGGRHPRRAREMAL